jgi:hypothetical protein
VSIGLAVRANRARAAAIRAEGAEAKARQESDRLRRLAEEKAELEAKARELAQKAQAAEADQRKQTADAWAAEKEQRHKAEYEGYVARIGLAAAKISNREFLAAQSALEACPPGPRHWEWGRLRYLCQLDQRTFNRQRFGIAITSNGKWVIADALGDGGSSRLIVRDAETGEAVFNQKVSVAPSLFGDVVFS